MVYDKFLPLLICSVHIADILCINLIIKRLKNVRRSFAVSREMRPLI